MLQHSKSFASFSVNNIENAMKFYRDTLGFDVTEEKGMGLSLKINNGSHIFIYSKDNHVPATFTVLNIPVDNIDTAVEDLKAKGIEFEYYETGMIKTDETGIARGSESGMGPDIAWFKDPADNFISLLQN